MVVDKLGENATVLGTIDAAPPPGFSVPTLSSASGCEEASPKSIANTSSVPLVDRTMKLDVVRSPWTT